MKFDGKAFGAEIVGVVKGYLEKELAPLAARMDALEKRIEAIPAPVDLSSDLAALKTAIEAIVIPEIPNTPELPDITAIVGKAIKEAAAAIPAPEDGKDGLGLACAFIDRDGNLVLTMTNGEPKNLGPVVGKDGEPGKPGRDGFNLEDFDASVMDDGRTVLLSFTGKQLDYKVELGFPVMLYRGVFKDGQPYERGDTVTWAGSLWHCDKATSEKPGDGSKDWTLCAKKGRDGKNGEAKEAKPFQPLTIGTPAKGK
ncbi:MULTISPECIES: hypothetical protein [Rhizobium]|uniref:Portal protein-like protein n=1 Tax=Rhizobium favelukesii TaxID=348824 RepID=W6R7B2_9HYPH|nr:MULTISPECIES: hypothetical protein [Rhizobium]MCS0462990.1 hypothetical protein [Rhizobium favelukesii]UFS82048.1 hypothetical protein LPB79_27825 [Rhizobium sp. T136]CDM56280.1 putative portal protein-like protein [Rhizobium favelukesii]